MAGRANALPTRGLGSHARCLPPGGAGWRRPQAGRGSGRRAARWRARAVPVPVSNVVVRMQGTPREAASADHRQRFAEARTQRLDDDGCIDRVRDRGAPGGPRGWRMTRPRRWGWGWRRAPARGARGRPRRARPAARRGRPRDRRARRGQRPPRPRSRRRSHRCGARHRGRWRRERPAAAQCPGRGRNRPSPSRRQSRTRGRPPPHGRARRGKRPPTTRSRGWGAGHGAGSPA